MRRIWKLGGSLLDLPDWPARVRAIVAARRGPRDIDLLVVGGGALADEIRRWDARYDLGAAAAHELAMATLTVTHALTARLLPDWPAVRTPPEAPGCYCLDLAAEIARLEAAGCAAPHDWSATSDSLAAVVATAWPADALILFKSCDQPQQTSWSDWAADGSVDTFFPTAAQGLHVEWINPRDCPSGA